MALRFDARTNQIITDASAVAFGDPLVTLASATGAAGLNVPEGVAPSAPVDGDIWVTAAGEFFVRLNGVSIDLSAAGGGTVTSSGTPLNNQVAVFTSGTDIDSNADFTYSGTQVLIQNTSNLSMGSETGDRIIMHTGGYSLGILANTLYFNSNADFEWYDGGTGGDLLMTLAGTAGNLTVEGAIQNQAGNIISANGALVCDTYVSVAGASVNGDGIWFDGNTPSGNYGIYTSDQSDATFGGRYGADTNSDWNFYWTQNLGTNRGMYFKLGGKAAGDIVLGIHPGGVSSKNPLFIAEQAAANTDVLTFGQFWVRNDAPNVPMFTNDVGTDFELAVGAGFTTTWSSGGGTSFGTGATSGFSSGATQTFAAGAIFEIEETTTMADPAAAHGRFWVRDDIPNVPMFTDDAGDDHVLNASGSGDVTKVGTPVNNELGVWTGDGTLEGDAGLIWDATKLLVEVDSATTNAAIPVLTLSATSTGTPVAGIGPSIEFQAETAAGAPGNQEIGAVIYANTTSVTSTNEVTELVFLTQSGGGVAAERARVTALGLEAARFTMTGGTGDFEIRASGTTATLDANGSTVLDIAGMDENDTGLRLGDGMSLSFTDRASANRIYCQNIGVGGGSGEIEWTATSSGLMSFNFPIDMKDQQIRGAVLDDVAFEAQSVGLSSNIATLAYGSAVAHEVDLATASANVTINLTGGPPASTFGRVVVAVTQDTTTHRTITWQGGGADVMVWPGGTQPTLTASDLAIDIFEFLTWDSGSTWYGYLIGANFS